MTEEWKLDHRARKRIKEVKKKARPGNDIPVTYIAAQQQGCVQMQYRFLWLPCRFFNISKYLNNKRSVY